MKNSPHRHKHQRAKALRKACQIDLNPPENKVNPMPEFNSHLPEKDRLKPISIKTAKDILNIYKKHLEHARFERGTHHPHKRTTPGQVEDEMPKIQKRAQKIQHSNMEAHLEKSSSLARKLIKHHNEPYKKAA